MLLAGLYVCLRCLVDLILIRQPQAQRDAELLLPRHELSVLRRSVKRPRPRIWDRMILSALAMRLPRSKWNALIVRPETVLVGIALWSVGSGRPTAGEDRQHDRGCRQSAGN